MKKTCLFCKLEFEVDPRVKCKQAKKVRFCSRSCWYKWGVGPRAGAWKGGTVNHSGYKMIFVNGKYKFEHRIVIESMIGRNLSPDERVHHIDGNKLNNSPSNLAIMSKSEHSKLESNRYWTPRKNPPCKCGRPFHSKGYCRYCYMLFRYSRMKRPKCSCGRKSFAVGLCGRCYSAQRKKKGDPML